MKGVRQQYEGCISGTYTLHTSGIIKAFRKYESRINEHTRSIKWFGEMPGSAFGETGKSGMTGLRNNTTIGMPDQVRHDIRQLSHYRGRHPSLRYLRVNYSG